MAITNGYNETVVLTALETRIGWKQPTQSGYDIVDTDNQTATSGKYFNSNSFHPILTVQNLIDCQPDKELLEDEDLVNTYLSDLRKDNVLSALTSVFNAPQFIESGLIFEKVEHSEHEAVTNAGKFVGVRFKLSDSDVTSMINNAMLYFNGVKTFNLYLYHEYKGLLSTISVTTVASKQVIKAIGEAISNNNSTVKGGVYFLGYFQDDLDSVQAINTTAYNESAKHYDACAFEADVTGSGTFDMVTYALTNNTFGLNVEVSTYRDLTAKIVANAHLFDNLLGLMMVQKTIEIIANSPRLTDTKNINEGIVNGLMRQLNGYKTSDDVFVKGIVHKIAAECKSIQEAFMPKPKATVVSC